MTPALIIEVCYKKLPRRFRDLSGRNDENMVEQDPTIGVLIEDRMTNHHTGLVEHRCDVVASARACRINLVVGDGRCLALHSTG